MITVSWSEPQDPDSWSPSGPPSSSFRRLPDANRLDGVLQVLTAPDETRDEMCYYVDSVGRLRRQHRVWVFR